MPGFEEACRSDGFSSEIVIRPWIHKSGAI